MCVRSGMTMVPCSPAVSIGLRRHRFHTRPQRRNYRGTFSIRPFMIRFADLDALRAACTDLPSGNDGAAAAVAARQAELTKPPGSLGRLEELAAWLARWQG